MSLEQKRGLLELRCWIQIMTCHEDNEISFEIPSISKGSIQVSGFKSTQAPADESVIEVKKENAVADVFLGSKIIYNWPVVCRTVDESHHVCVLTNQ